MSIIETIRAEVERLKKDVDNTPLATEQIAGYLFALVDVQKFLDTLQEQPVCEELEEAASNAGFDYVDDIVLLAEPNHRWNDHDVEQAYIDGFKAGAKWQKEKDAELIEIAYNDGITIGKTKQKEQMMKEAVEGEVCIPNVWAEYEEGKELIIRAEISKELGFRLGDKVRIIIVKEDKQ